MYYQYWGMHKAPFDNVPDPDLYWSKNNSLEDAISEVLFAVEEGNDCLAVVTGDIGAGKTLGLRVILNELDSEKYRIAFITNPDLSPVQFMREIIGQLENKKITTHFKDQLMEEFNSILFTCANKGQKAVIFIDEANVMSTEQLHQVRLMTNLQDNQKNMVIFVLAGQKELGKRLESKSLENLFQRIGVYCRIRGLDGPEAVQAYLEHRIQACGGSTGIFAKDAYTAIWTYSHKGVPRLINKIAKLCLKAGETNLMKRIGADAVHAVAAMFEREKPTLTLALKGDDSSRQDDQESQETARDPREQRSEVIHVVPSPAPVEHEKPPLIRSLKEDSSLRQKEQEPARDLREQHLSESAVRTDLDPEMMSLIKGLPSQVLSQVQMMEDKQLYSLAGKMAIQCLQEKYPKNSTEDPVVVWDAMKGRIYSALKSLREPMHYCLA